METGYVYFIQGEQGGPVKIGWTTNILSRIRSLQTGYPYKLILLGSMRGEPKVEARLHRRFRAERISEDREWFNASRRLIAFIASQNTGGEKIGVVSSRPKRAQAMHLEPIAVDSRGVVRIFPELTVRSIDRLVSAGKMPEAFRVGGKRLWRTADLRSWATRTGRPYCLTHAF